MPNVKFKARAAIPLRSKMDTDSKNLLGGQVDKGEVVTITSTQEKDGIVYGRLRKGVYVIVKREGVLNFDRVS